MKKSFFFLVMIAISVITCVITSCSKDEEAIHPYLIGKWYCENAGAGWNGSTGNPCTIVFGEKCVTVLQEFDNDYSNVPNTLEGEYVLFDNGACNYKYGKGNSSFINIQRISDTSITLRGMSWPSIDGTYIKQ